jgi:hypothetical protein
MTSPHLISYSKYFDFYLILTNFLSTVKLFTTTSFQLTCLLRITYEGVIDIESKNDGGNKREEKKCDR